MSKTKRIIILVNLLLLIGYFNWSIMAKEKTLSSGHLVLLELAPVDPRSLIQGDYMRLNYKINGMPEKQQITKRGYCIIKQDAKGVGQRIRFQDELQPLQPGELAVKYFTNGNRYFTTLHIGAESFLFEEGQDKLFSNAEYGGLKVDDAGNSVLEGLYDEHLQMIKYK